MAPASAPDLDRDWLVVVDMQHVFADASSPWAAPRYAEAAAVVERLLPRFAGRTVFTRYVAPETPHGAWREYFADWPFALVPADDPMYALTEPFAGTGDPVVTATTFGKWGTSLQAVVAGGPGDDRAPGIVVVGVSTDCCVLSTVLPAADAGIRVTVVADGCAGASDADHERALAAMALYAPLVRVVASSTLDADRAVGGSA